MGIIEVSFPFQTVKIFLFQTVIVFHSKLSKLIAFFIAGNNMRSCTKLSYDREPLNQLLEAAVAAYVNTTHSR
jgi:hypothetical protein